jgi:hypothetical protein
MIGIPFHWDAGWPSGSSAEVASGVSVCGANVFVGARVGRTVSVTVGIVVGLGCIKLEQATRINIGKRRLAAMGFFTRPSL